MAKEFRRECPDCDGPDLSHISIFGSKGDGICRNCHGEGKVTDVIRALAGPIVGFPVFERCPNCSGTCKCQTCGGTGYQYYNEEASKENSKDNTTSSDYSYSRSYSSSTTSSGGDSSLAGCIGLFVMLSIGIGLFKSCSTSNNSQQIAPVQYEQQPSQREQVYTSPLQVRDCEKNHTGTYLFTNATDKTVYLFLENNPFVGNCDKVNLEIRPRQKVIQDGLLDNGHPYEYHCSYNKKWGSVCDISGTFGVKSCSTGTLTLELPACYTHTIDTTDIWTQINVPDGYSLYSPCATFYIRFGDDPTEHSGNCTGFINLEEGIRKVYIKNANGRKITFSVVKNPEKTSNNSEPGNGKEDLAQKNRGDNESNPSIKQTENSNCEQNNTGSYYFNNTTSQRLIITLYIPGENTGDYVQVDRFNNVSVKWTKEMGAAPSETCRFNNVSATTVFYIIRDPSISILNAQHGTVEIEKCKTKTMDITKTREYE